jgi:ornithine cyclodeaminase/alanine dehydrogenase-like protein (mu-crystallin family)
MTEAPSDNFHSDDFVVLNQTTIGSLVDIPGLIEIAASALQKTSNGVALQDVRRVLDLPNSGGGCLSIMYAALTDRPAFGAKVLSVLPGNFTHGLPSHRGGILLFEKEHGRPIALLDGGEVTAWRTAAASAVATRALSRPDSAILALLGYGEQAQKHIATISKVRPIREIRVWGRDPGKAERFAQVQRDAGFEAKAFREASDCVTGADIVCTVTSAETPVLFGHWLSPGTHVNAVGASVPSCQEIDVECVRRAQLWVDYMPMALAAAAELILALAEGAISKDHIRGEIGAVLNGTTPGRQTAADITLYRSLGVPAQDIELANFLYSAARATGIGVRVSFGG